MKTVFWFAAMALATTPLLAQNKMKYTVKKGDTVIGIARQFGMKPQELMALNRLANPDRIREGQELTVIPSHAPEALASVTLVAKPIKLDDNRRYHVVAKGETLSSIARKYSTTAEALAQWNNFISPHTKLKEGQKIIVGTLDQSVGSRQFITGKGRIVNERGMGAVISGIDNQLSVALHRTAPEGTIIRIYNESTKKAVFAKVIGKLPNIDSEKKIIVKLSKGACRALGVVGERFPVEVTYEK
ncbi:MAG: LysM peptidoglycan-binding domain-containing protein [Cytophagales bacterium]|nr:LysM peptidoglycan-binding domain-containing protein [Bernardetiaceae bacterium]MDW8209794.1 LysM peptidoglycan-binding domain-containing protein [Cytophagales bacterium]